MLRERSPSLDSHPCRRGGLTDTRLKFLQAPQVVGPGPSLANGHVIVRRLTPGRSLRGAFGFLDCGFIAIDS